tara:strand:+ start:3975 stop:4169 length:195 start_codon:yes stop_codon:yes gene_type:complete
MSKDIGEQFAMMNEVSAKISQKTFDKFIEEAMAEYKGDLNELKIYEFLTTKIAEIIDMHYDGEL